MVVQQFRNSSHQAPNWLLARLLVLSAASVMVSVMLETCTLPADGIFSSLRAPHAPKGLPPRTSQAKHRIAPQPNTQHLSIASNDDAPSISSEVSSFSHHHTKTTDNKRHLLGKKASSSQDFAHKYRLRSAPYHAHAAPNSTPTTFIIVQPQAVAPTMLINSLSEDNPTATATAAVITISSTVTRSSTSHTSNSNRDSDSSSKRHSKSSSRSRRNSGTRTKPASRTKSEQPEVQQQVHSPGPLYVDFAPIDGSVFWLQNRGRGDAPNCPPDLSVHPETNTPTFLSASTFEMHQKWRLTLAPGTTDTFFIQSLAPSPGPPASALDFCSLSPFSHQLPGSFLSYSTNCDVTTLGMMPSSSSPSQQGFRLTRLSPSSNEFVLRAAGRSACASRYLSAPGCIAAEQDAGAALPHFAGLPRSGPKSFVVFELMHTATANGFPLAHRTFRIRSTALTPDLFYNPYLSAPSCTLPDSSVRLSPSASTNPISPSLFPTTSITASKTPSKTTASLSSSATSAATTASTASTTTNTFSDTSAGDEQLLWTFHPLHSSSQDLFVIQSLHRQRGCPEAPSYLSHGLSGPGVALEDTVGKRQVFRVLKTPGSNTFVFTAVFRQPGTERYLSAPAAASVEVGNSGGGGSSGDSGGVGAAVELTEVVGVDAVFELLLPA